MSQPIAMQIRELLEVRPQVEAKVPPVDQLLSLFEAGGVSASISTQRENTIVLAARPGSPIHAIPGGVVWQDGTLSDDTIMDLAVWLLALFDGHELWMADGSGAVAFQIDLLTLREKLALKSAGIEVVDPELPSNL